MRRKFATVLGLCCSLALFFCCTSCGGPVITAKSFAGRCLMYSPGGVDSGSSCGSQPQLCDQFNAVVSADYSGRQACLDACGEIKNKLYSQYLIGACHHTVRYAWRNCNNFCRANYE